MTSLHNNDLFSVKDKTVLVTGGSRGIGLMIARTLVENGAKVYISSRKAIVCQAVAEELSKIGTCIAIPADLSSSDGRAHLVNALKEQEGGLDVLVNNAGANWGAPFPDYPESGYDKVMDLNVKSIFFLTQDLLPLLLAKASLDQPANVINIGSIDGMRVSTMDNSAYGVSKIAVHHLTKILAVKLQGKGITVNAVAPGPFRSKMTESMLDTFQKQVEGVNPMKRIGVDGDMGGIVVFLASRAGSYINGAVIPVDGGMHLLSMV